MTPDTELEESTAPVVREVRFGDNYRQAFGDGLNSNAAEMFACRWTYLNKTQADYIWDFLKPKEGWEAFWWTPPFQDTPKKYIAKAKTLKRTTLSNQLFHVSVDLERVFDL